LFPPSELKDFEEILIFTTEVNFLFKKIKDSSRRRCSNGKGTAVYDGMQREV